MEDLFYDYSRIAYSGYKLSQISTIISYSKVSSALMKRVKIIIQTNNLDLLAHTLYELSLLFFNSNDTYVLEQGIYDLNEQLFDFIDKSKRKVVVSP